MLENDKTLEKSYLKQKVFAYDKKTLGADHYISSIATA